MKPNAAALALLLILTAPAAAQEATIAVRADKVLHRLSPYLTGACLEDVNHEVYGGLYSQMVFGESFQEPAPPPRLKGFTPYGGGWRPVDGVLEADAGPGPKLVADGVTLADGAVGVEVSFRPAEQGGNAGLVVKVADPAVGADEFTGYEVSFDAGGSLVLGRHRRNWEPLRTVRCPAPVGRWAALGVKTSGRRIEVTVDGRTLLTYDDAEHPLAPGAVGLRTWRRAARFRNLRVDTGGGFRSLPFKPVEADAAAGAVSGMWRALRSGTAEGDFALESTDPFVGARSQRVTFRRGEGRLGVENRGLNRWGLNVVAGKPFEGYLWARAAEPTPLSLALESGDGSRSYAEARVEVRPGGWARYEFSLTPSAADRAGRFAVALKQPGSVVLGHAFLQPGDWGRFKGLPVRKDVADALVAQGLTVLRYGGSMVNHPAYRWKAMIGPRDRRPPTPGTWYPYSSNGWGIVDFLAFCEAAGFLAVPAFNMGETPADLADFVEYATGPADSPWGRRRADDGHPAPFRLTHLQLGNEEAVNDEYVRKFRALAEAIWAKDPKVILVVGDFAYGRVIADPFHFEGGAVVNSLAGHRAILDLARERGREVWFDIHIGTDHPPQPNHLRPERSYIDHLEKLAAGANFKVAVFEFNAGNHALKRALSNACAVNAIERVGGRIPVACSANCLQPDGQNDNGWDQGLLFFDPARVWLQPPGHVTALVARHRQPLLVESRSQSPGDALDVTATRSDDGRTLVLKVVNTGPRPIPTRIDLAAFTPSRPLGTAETLAGDPEAANTAESPGAVAPVRSAWWHTLPGGKPSSYTFPAHSFTVLRME